MKNIITILSLALVSLTTKAQTFWTENFGTGCNRAQLAGAYTGSNGAWAIVTTGTNDPYADGWYVSAAAAGTAVSTCSGSCLTGSNTNQTLHIGNAAFSTMFGGAGADTGSTYLTGVLCGAFTICSTTNKRVQSPVINCAGKTGISISFLYYENAELNGDYATLVYSADGGTTWSNIIQMPQTTTTCAAPAGTWTSYTASLPASANNNPNVKIGFNWVNNNNGQGSDPSFAVDDIILQTPTGITEPTASSITVVVVDNGVLSIKSASAYRLLSVANMLGQPVKYEQDGNKVWLNNKVSGIYFVSFDVDGTKVTKKIVIE